MLWRVEAAWLSLWQLEAAANSLRLRSSELERSVETTLSRTRQALVAAGTALFLLLWWVSVAVRRSITRPLQALVAAARQVDGGDLSARIATDARDELGELSRVLGHTVARLRELLVSVHQAGQETAAAVERLAAAADEQNRSVSRQADAVAQASARAQEIRQMSDVAAHQASEVLRSADAITLTGAGFREPASITGVVWRDADARRSRNRASAGPLGVRAGER